MESCRPKLPLDARPLIGALEAERVGTLFKSLAHPTRLRLLHALIRVDELSVGDLADETGMTVQAISNQLQRLAEVGVKTFEIHWTLHGSFRRSGVRWIQMQDELPAAT